VIDEAELAKNKMKIEQVGFNAQKVILHSVFKGSNPGIGTVSQLKKYLKSNPQKKDIEIAWTETQKQLNLDQMHIFAIDQLKELRLEDAHPKEAISYDDFQKSLDIFFPHTDKSYFKNIFDISQQLHPKI